VDVTSAPPVLTRALAAQRPVVERLWQLYAHDLSQFRGTMPDAAGRFPTGRLPLYFEAADRSVHLVEVDGAAAGFAMVRGLGEERRVLGEFFVVRALRRRGVGRSLARAVLEEHPGGWEIAFQEENPGAAAFWRAVAASLPGTTFREERRPVPDKPHVPPDTWLVLDRG
jgi:predicted acetyltransferase